MPRFVPVLILLTSVGAPWLSAQSEDLLRMQDTEALKADDVDVARMEALIRQYFEAPKYSAKRESLRKSARKHLWGWFDRLHEHRQKRHAEQEEKIKAQRARLSVARSRLDNHHNQWLQRIVVHLAEKPQEENAHHPMVALLPGILRILVHEDPEAAQELGTLAEKEDPRLFRKLSELIDKDPELAERARAMMGPEEQRLEAFLSALSTARKTVAPFIKGDGSVVVPPKQRNAVAKVLQEVSEAEFAWSEANIREAERALERYREVLKFRKANKKLLVDLQLARMFDEEDRYEW